MVARITEGGGRGVGGSMGSKRVKVSPNVTVVAPKRKTIPTAEVLRLGNINKTKLKLKPKYQAQADKAEAKTMKAAAKPKPRTDTKYVKSDSFGKTTITARERAKEEVAKRAARRATRAY